MVWCNKSFGFMVYFNLPYVYIVEHSNTCPFYIDVIFWAML